VVLVIGLPARKVAFCKRSSRAREDMEAFLFERCRLAERANRCRSKKRFPHRARGRRRPFEPARIEAATTREADRLHIEEQRVRSAVEVFVSDGFHGGNP
jgi:hypothetical protein